ncbi:MAG: outer membrane lipoprotein carrier protein LolA [Prevotella sp.]|nr:outer membrane lipoprotein carrier protein LolA [Prevotella sp.]
MKKILLFLFCLFSVAVSAQTVTKTSHKKAVKTDVVTTGTMTVRKPDYICISTDNDKDQLIMDGTQFTMTMGGKKHTTDSRKNAQFATFQSVLTAVINGQPIPTGDDLAVTTQGGRKTITITPDGKKRRQLFTSFVLVIDAKTSAFKVLRMNGRNEDYTEYVFK